MKTTRKILAFLVAAATILTAACDKTEKKTEEKKSLSVLLESISFDSAGGVQELGINASSGCMWTVSADADWIKLSPILGKGEGVVNVTADANVGYEMRTGTIIVASEGLPDVKVSVVQEPAKEPEEDAVILKTVNCYYAGDFWGTDGKLDDVYLEMTDMVISENGNVKGPGIVLSLDLNIAAATYDTFSIEGTFTPNSVLPPAQKGTFNVDAEGDTSPTYILECDENGGNTRKDIVGGEVTIRKSGESYSMEMMFTFPDETSLKVAYNGIVNFYDDTNDGNSTLKENITPSFTAVTGEFASWGQDGVTSDVLVLNFSGDEAQNPRDYMTMFLNVPKTAWKSGNIDGEYNIIEKDINEILVSDLVPGTAIPGYLSKDNDNNLVLGGGWYYSRASIDGQSQLANMAPFTSGTLKIEHEGDTYTITYSFTDDNLATPHTISGKYTGTVILTNVQGEKPDPEKPDPEKPDPDKPDPDEPAKPLIDLIAGGNLGQFTDGGRW